MLVTCLRSACAQARLLRRQRGIELDGLLLAREMRFAQQDGNTAPPLQLAAIALLPSPHKSLPSIHIPLSCHATAITHPSLSAVLRRREATCTSSVRTHMTHADKSQTTNQQASEHRVVSLACLPVLPPCLCLSRPLATLPPLAPPLPPATRLCASPRRPCAAHLGSVSPHLLHRLSARLPRCAAAARLPPTPCCLVSCPWLSFGCASHPAGLLALSPPALTSPPAPAPLACLRRSLIASRPSP